MGVEWHRISLNEEIINAGVSPYWRVRVINETTSTQNEIGKIISSGAAQSGEVLIAEYQSEGRGRLERKFIAPPKSSLLFSIYLQNNFDLNWIPLIAGIGVCKAIPEAKLKWPNDIILNDKKCGGILSEKVSSGVIVGIGINVNQTKEELPVPDATSLSLNGLIKNRNELLVAILQEIGKLIRNWPTNKLEIHQNYVELCSTLGRKVEATMPNGEKITGIANGVTEDGELLVGSMKLNVGDILHLR